MRNAPPPVGVQHRKLRCHLSVLEGEQVALYVEKLAAIIGKVDGNQHRGGLRRDDEAAPYSRSKTACTITMRRSSRLRRPAWVIAARVLPITRDWILCVGTAASGPAPAISAVTSFQARARKPAASISVCISTGGRRKLFAASRAHMTGKIGGCTV